jgi:hypothetical protein
MAKTILAFAIAFLGAMTVFAAAAEACISCNYVPEVVNSPSKSYGAKRYKKERVNRAAKKRKARPAKKRAVKRKTITKKVETAKTAPIKRETKNESSSISAAPLEMDEASIQEAFNLAKAKHDLKVARAKARIKREEKEKVETAKTAPIKMETKNESSSISTASLDKDETIEMEIKAKDEPKVARDVGCKKFFPSVGMTLTVSCE